MFEKNCRSSEGLLVDCGPGVVAGGICGCDGLEVWADAPETARMVRASANTLRFEFDKIPFMTYS
jgi:hypothetical protein